MELFPDEQPEDLLKLYKKLNKNKEMLIEAILNGGVPPESFQQEPPRRA